MVRVPGVLEVFKGGMWLPRVQPAAGLEGSGELHVPWEKVYNSFDVSPMVTG